MIRFCIDPGHGGPATGIVRDRLVEKDINLMLAEELAYSFTAISDRLQISMTRTDDSELTLTERGDASDEAAADLVISIHVNGHAKTSVHGADLFYSPGDRVARDVAKEIAVSMPRELQTGRVWEASARPGDPSSSWLERPHRVIKPHNAPVVLVECGYASNLNDRNYILRPWARSSIVNAIRAGVCRFSKWST